MSCVVVFFFKQKTAYEMRISDWSSDVCSSDLKGGQHNEFVSSLYREIIGWRFAQGLPTLITGNLAGDEAVRQILGDRVFDRLHDSAASKVISMWKAQSMRRGRK